MRFSSDVLKKPMRFKRADLAWDQVEVSARLIVQTLIHDCLLLSSEYKPEFDGLAQDDLHT